MLGHALIPSFREIAGSRLRTPIVTISSRFAFVVRSGLITVQESPRSVDLKTLLPAARSVPGSFGEKRSGVSQLKRYASPAAGAGVTLPAAGRMVLTSPVTLFRRIMLPSCDSA